MSRKSSVVGALAVVAVAVTGSAGAISATSADDDNGKRLGSRQIVGTWEATVNRGPVLPPIKSLHTFSRDGSIVEGGSELFRSSAFGAWEYVGARTYATTQVFHRFSPTGTYLGTQRINASRRLSPDGDSYTGVAVGQLRDPDGNLTATLPSATVTATRLQIERIPNQP